MNEARFDWCELRERKRDNDMSRPVRFGRQQVTPADLEPKDARRAGRHRRCEGASSPITLWHLDGDRHRF